MPSTNMKPKVKIHDKTNSTVTNNLSEFPHYTIKCKLGKVMKERGIKLQELSDLTGIRVATISELVNLKRTTINIPHLLVIAKTLRIVDISELFEFELPDDTYNQFIVDRKEIEKQGILDHQQESLNWIKYENKLITEFNKMIEQRKNPPTD